MVHIGAIVGIGCVRFMRLGMRKLKYYDMEEESRRQASVRQYEEEWKQMAEQERRRKIDEMNSLRSLLQKLQVVFDPPARIQAAMDNDAVEVAVDYYVKAAPFLRQNGDREQLRL